MGKALRGRRDCSSKGLPGGAYENLDFLVTLWTVT